MGATVAERGWEGARGRCMGGVQLCRLVCLITRLERDKLAEVKMRMGDESRLPAGAPSPRPPPAARAAGEALRPSTPATTELCQHIVVCRSLSRIVEVSLLVGNHDGPTRGQGRVWRRQTEFCHGAKNNVTLDLGPCKNSSPLEQRCVEPV